MKPNQAAKEQLIAALKERKLKVAGFILLSILSGIFEVVGIGLVFPFIYILAVPEAMKQFKIVNWIINIFHLKTATQLNLLLFTFIALLICLKLLCAILYKYIQMRFLIKAKTALSGRLMKMYLALNLSYHTEEGTNNIMYNISIVTVILDQYIMSLVKIIVASTIIIGLLAMLCLVLPSGALMSLIIYAGLLFSVYKLTKEKFRRLGQEETEIYNQRQVVLVSSLGAIRETKVFGKETFFIDKFRDVETQNFSNQQWYNFLGSMPPLLVEAGVLIGIMALVSYYLYKGDHGHVLAILSIMLAVMFRILPQINQILVGLQLLNNSITHVNAVADALSQYEHHVVDFVATEEKLNFNQSLRCQDINFRYTGQATDYILKDINLTITPGQFVGLTGHSAAGKSTFVSVLLGLLEPESGHIYVDDVLLKDKLLIRKWLNNVGFVPQSTYIFQTSIIANIAFGVPDDEIDFVRVYEVMKLARLDDFVEMSKEALTKPLGENGAKLSGGQRQRLGIARALYADPSVLILDESTANLDANLEYDILQNILAMRPRKTILFITHRLNSLRGCDQILVFSQGKIIGQGAFALLEQTCPEFKALTNKAQLSAGVEVKAPH